MSFTWERVSVTTTDAAIVVVSVAVLELCPCVDVGALEVLLDGPDVELAWLEEDAIVDVAVDKIVVE